MFKKLKQYFLLSNIMIIIFIFLSVILLILGLGIFPNSLISYVSYLFSSYTLICVSLKIYNVTKKVLYENKYTNRYFTDKELRFRLSLYSSFLINCFFSLSNFMMGLFSKSMWFIVLSFYYISLTIIRFTIIKNYREKSSYIESLNDSKNIRYLLFLLNITATGIIIQIIVHNKGFSYNGNLIYIVALYSFYSIIANIYNYIKYRKNKNTLVSTAKTLALSVSIVSIFTLQTAMLSSFGGSALLKATLNRGVGGTVIILILFIYIISIINIKRRIKNDIRVKE